MIIVTWNINSIRLRINLLKKLVEKLNPDIICLQETKVIDGLFPVEECKSMGFNYIEFCGEKSYNGVAILSKLPLTGVQAIKISHDTDCRHITAIIGDKFALHNIYVPAGGDEPDPISNPKFAYKLRFLDELSAWFKTNKSKQDNLILLGDLNVAPLEQDVWSHKQLLKVVSHTPIEVEKLNNLKQSLDFIDLPRKFVPANEKLYSWWSYRNRDWKKSNRGRRLDHIWSTRGLEKLLLSSYIIKEVRDWQQPSDHVPVVAVFDL